MLFATHVSNKSYRAIRMYFIILAKLTDKIIDVSIAPNTKYGLRRRGKTVLSPRPKPLNYSQ